MPKDFRFSLKLSKEITHVKNLQYDPAVMERFMRSASGAGNKKGCLLVQFPGKITLDYFKQVEQIMQELEAFDPAREWKKAVEFRSASWYTGETIEMLDEFGAAMVLHDHPKAKMPEVRGKARFVYIRFHGPRGDYRDEYTDKFLRGKAAEIREWLNEGKDVYAYFNNTIGNAFGNAVGLKALLEEYPVIAFG